MNRELTKLQQILEPYGLDAAALLRRLSREPQLLASPTRLELRLPGGAECCLSRCALEPDGRRRFLAPYELAGDEALDLHYLTIGGRVYQFYDLWQGPWSLPWPAAAPVSLSRSSR